MRRTLVGLASAVMVLMTTVPAGANLFVGTCALQVDFTFTNGAIGPNTGSKNYIVVVNPVSGAAKPCYTTEAFDQVGRSTTVDATGNASIWNCSTTALGSGLWYQVFRKQNGEASPAPINGQHRINGTWGAWTLQVENWNPISALGAIELTLDPLTAASDTQRCAAGTLVTLHTIGTMVFEDPILPVSPA